MKQDSGELLIKEIEENFTELKRFEFVEQKCSQNAVKDY